MSGFVDVVVVSYNSAEQLRSCVEPLVTLEDVNVIVVDNASSDDSLATVADLPLTAVARATNDGFATGCNVGWKAGAAPFVLFLNPDAAIDGKSLQRLASLLEGDSSIGAVAPRIERSDGSLVHSLRRFPRLRSTYGRALFLHRALPRAGWADEVVRDHRRYAVAGDCEWVSGACVLVRRSVLLEIGGFDERFFLYCEDKDLCRRVWKAGFRVTYEPLARARHAGGASTPRNRFQAMLAQSRLRYAVKHSRPLDALLERVGIALGAATHALVGGGGREARLDHLRALRTTLGRDP